VVTRSRVVRGAARVTPVCCQPVVEPGSRQSVGQPVGGVCVGLGLGLPLGDGEPVGEGLPVGLGELLGLPVGVGVGDGLWEEGPVGVGDPDGLTVGLGSGFETATQFASHARAAEDRPAVPCD
jgi:hypothetical protein